MNDVNNDVDNAVYFAVRNNAYGTTIARVRDGVLADMRETVEVTVRNRLMHDVDTDLWNVVDNAVDAVVQQITEHLTKT